MRKIVIILTLLIATMGGVLFIQQEESSHKVPKSNNALHVSIPNPEQLLQFFELSSSKNTLHPDWYEFINPIAYVVTNGIIQSISGYLLIDFTQPLHLAFTWEREQVYPTILVSLPSHQGLQGAANLGRNLKTYGTIQQQRLQWHGNIQLPHLSPSSLSWEGTKEQIILAWRPYPSTEPFDLSVFSEEKKPTRVTINGHVKYIPPAWTYSIPLSHITLNMSTTSKFLRIKGTATGTHPSIPKPSYPLKMIAGWNIPGFSPLQIHKINDSGFCFAGPYTHIQKHLDIQSTCPIVETRGVYAFFSKDFFAHIDIPLQYIELYAQGEEETFHIEGSIIKEDERGLFPLYVWLYSLFTMPESR